MSSQNSEHSVPSDFDLEEYINKIRILRPPFTCPVVECGKRYKSFSGIQHHLTSFDHENPNNNPNCTPGVSLSKGASPGNGSNSSSRRSSFSRKSKARRSGKAASSDCASDNEIKNLIVRYIEDEQKVEVEADDRTLSLTLMDDVPVFSKQQVGEDKLIPLIKEISPPKSSSKTPKTPRSNFKSSKGKSKNKNKETPSSSTVGQGQGAEDPNQPPIASYTEVDHYDLEDAPPRPQNYIRFIEKCTDDLEEEVEYDADEEDLSWLQAMNKRREAESIPPISQEHFELLMDRLEKESYFQMQSSGKESDVPIDDDAFCCICMDGECENTNVILFCDMCNLPVHQDCYGVPYIPEGQWLCRRCLQSPSKPVDCVLCPNKGGAFKMTSDGRWAHVVCALWIPEVVFSNVVFLEPIDGIGSIPTARWKLCCYLCKARGIGACIQCNKTNCYTAFHVTCAQAAGLHMKIEAMQGPHSGVFGANIKKFAFCDVHTPSESEAQPLLTPLTPGNTPSSNQKTSVSSSAKSNQMTPSGPTPAQRERQRERVKKIRKMLAENRVAAAPVVAIPKIPADRVLQIASLVSSVQRRNPFVSRLMAYWTLKRQARNGAPLLRRLQTVRGSAPTERNSMSSQDQVAFIRDRMMFWRRIRQDLERARLLCELVRKREKAKREELQILKQMFVVNAAPFNIYCKALIDAISDLDKLEIFASPVDPELVPGYRDIIQNPIDLSTMRDKVDLFAYSTLEDLKSDFDLMIRNCMTFNDSDTVFYRTALKLMEQGGALFRQAKRELEAAGFEPETGRFARSICDSLPSEEEILKKIDARLKRGVGKEKWEDVSDHEKAKTLFEEDLTDLFDLYSQANRLTRAVTRTTRTKALNKEIKRIKTRWRLEQRRRRRLMGGRDGGESSEDTTQEGYTTTGEEDSEEEVAPPQPVTPPPAPPVTTGKRGRKPSTNTPSKERLTFDSDADDEGETSKAPNEGRRRIRSQPQAASTSKGGGNNTSRRNTVLFSESKCQSPSPKRPRRQSENNLLKQQPQPGELTIPNGDDNPTTRCQYIVNGERTDNPTPVPPPPPNVRTQSPTLPASSSALRSAFLTYRRQGEDMQSDR
ncbi:unnamed protein product [Cyprideis torosa]|uniref:Uncharacterized protein n=1 Tax=Cyprideis torosa TaxID=163714 RepID=A0A7R8WA02_9CRUS|nr:unnamed protein product [Cyprideis torosa]CAG0887868.1 unnamed protein product [Cyprideis torosa]